MALNILGKQLPAMYTLLNSTGFLPIMEIEKVDHECAMSSCLITNRVRQSVISLKIHRLEKCIENWTQE